MQTSSYSAEYGRGGGANIQVTTKAGTNKFHESIWEFIRNDALDARNFFASSNARKPPFHRNQFGGAIGDLRQSGSSSRLTLRDLQWATAISCRMLRRISASVIRSTNRTKADNAENKKNRFNGGRQQSAAPGSSAQALAPDESTSLRNQLTAEVEILKSPEAAANWAHRVLRAKNTLTAADAESVEQAFQSRLSTLMRKSREEPHSLPDLERRPIRRKRTRRQSQAVDKTVLALATPRRIRDREHVKLVARQPCLICGRRPADAHHLRFAQSPALGHKVSDEFIVPLCRGHHRELHRCGDEASWWNKTGIDPTAAARTLWLKTRPLSSTIGESDSASSP